jgi:plastocyanin
LFTTAPGAITIANGAAPVYSVAGGTGPYTATSSNPAVAITPVGALVGGVLTITSAGPGSTNVLVVDALGASVTIGVTVTPAATTPLVVTPSTVTANVGDVLNFTVSGASPAYSIAVNNTSVATASSSAVATSGGAFTITLRNVGTTSVAITDALGQTTTLALTVNATATTLRLSPSAITVGENFAGSLALNVYGGTAPYSVFTDDLVLSGASIAGNVFTVGLGTSGNRCISSFDNTDPAAPVYTPYGTVPVTLTVVDSLGASATSVMTIRDNGVSGTFPGGC